MRNTLAVVIPNWNGANMIGDCIDGLRAQTRACTIIIVDNGSVDDSLTILRPMAKRGEIILIERERNYGYTGGVNPGIEYAINHGFAAVALLNNDALVAKDWLEQLAKRIDADPKIGIVTSKIANADGTYFDSTGNSMSIWGLPFGRGRKQAVSDVYDKKNRVLAASGGACLMRIGMLKQIGLFDQDFFAYYEDVDISLRARLAGWEIYYEPKATVRHEISATGSRNKAYFFTYLTFRNLPWLIIKNIPSSLLWRMLPRFVLAYCLFFGSAVTSGRGWPALKGLVVSVWRLPKKLIERHRIQSVRRISSTELGDLFTYDLPSDAIKLQKIRNAWWRLRGKKS